jgi:outer membrane protein OmpA-like peptidoglycan-associated protein
MRWSAIRGVAMLTLGIGLASGHLWAQPDPGDGDSSGKNMGDFKLRNLGTVVNTKDLEYAPTITADGKTLYFVSDRPGGVGGHDFWYTTKAGRLDTVFADPLNLGKPINTELNEGVASIAADGQTIFFTACNREDGLGDCDIYEAELDGDQWINVRNVTEINSPEWDSQPSISSDGKSLYFVSTRPGALGGDADSDIYLSTLQGDGKWSKPRNLGPPINTVEREDSPFIIAGGKVLYFSSAGHGGEGGLDFFTIKMGADGTWGQPENLGTPFNTSRDERFITLPAAGDVVYFASERTDLGNSGTLDIFMGILPPKTVTILIAGRVFDLCTNNNLPSELLFVDATKGDTLYTAKTTTGNGEYSFVVNAEGAMTIKVTGLSPGYPAIADTIGVPPTKTYMEIRKDFPLGQQPTISALVDTADYIKNLIREQGSSVPEKYRNFKGLVIEENLVKELYPLLTYVFFDSGSATIPDRYVLFTDPSQTQGFDETKIPGGTMQKYYHMLNIIGSRLRNNPTKNIEIVGNNSNQPDIGETKDISGKRGQVVYDYLINIWQIPTSQIKLMPPMDLPKFRSNIKDPLGIVENRRTEINSTEWEIMKPILQTELRRFPQPEIMNFQMKNGINDDLVARRAIEIKRNDQMWNVMADVGRTEATSPEYNWGRNANEDSIPNNETPYKAQLVVYSQDGKECRSNIIDVPVMIITKETKIRERLVDKTIDRYSLVLFKFDSPEAGPLNDRIIKEFIVDDLRKGAQVAVTGYTDVVGLDDRNLKLSQDRSKTVENAIKRLTKAGIIASLTGKGVGETAPLYSNDLPEGRFYNRTVQVIVETPTATDAATAP